MTNPYEIGQELAALFGRFEHALKRSHFLQNRPDAQADWNKFARELGPDFFEHVKRSSLVDHERAYTAHAQNFRFSR